MQSEQINELAAALAKAQTKIENAKLNKVNPHFRSKYADLAAIIDATRKPLAEHGLSVIQTSEMREGALVLITTLAHSSGQFIKSEYPLPVGKPQEMGSARTYARRYEWSSITGIAADEDDDANAAQEGGQKIDARAVAPRREPAVISPPIHPETGEVGPHQIPYDNNPVPWGGLYIAAIKTTKTADELNAWRHHNDATLVEIQNKAPKAFASIMKATLAQAQTFGALEAAE